MYTFTAKRLNLKHAIVRRYKNGRYTRQIADELKITIGGELRFRYDFLNKCVVRWLPEPRVGKTIASVKRDADVQLHNAHC